MKQPIKPDEGLNEEAEQRGQACHDRDKENSPGSEAK
jgi:hypothetical protein